MSLKVVAQDGPIQFVVDKRRILLHDLGNVYSAFLVSTHPLPWKCNSSSTQWQARSPGRVRPPHGSRESSDVCTTLHLVLHEFTLKAADPAIDHDSPGTSYWTITLSHDVGGQCSGDFDKSTVGKTSQERSRC